MEKGKQGNNSRKEKRRKGKKMETKLGKGRNREKWGRKRKCGDIARGNMKHHENSKTKSIEIGDGFDIQLE
jgi:hypothetical protein